MSDHQSHTTNNTMIMQYRTSTATGAVTTVDCQKQVRSWRLLRSLMELLIPSCNCTFVEENDCKKEEKWHSHHHQYYYRQPTFGSSTTTIIGTIFGSRRGKVSFCIQSIPRHHSTTAASPIILLLELAIPTVTLAREMKGGLLRIALEACNDVAVSGGSTTSSSSSSLLSTPVWTMYCNGKEAGLAVKRKPSKVDTEVLIHMESLPVGAGIISGKEINHHDHDDDDHQREDVLYMRAKYERIQGSSNYESFHLMDPDGNVGQELSFFFLRSR